MTVPGEGSVERMQLPSVGGVAEVSTVEHLDELVVRVGHDEACGKVAFAHVGQVEGDVGVVGAAVRGGGQEGKGRDVARQVSKVGRVDDGLDVGILIA